MSLNQLYRKLFKAALRIRLIEEEIIRIYPSDKIQSPVHLSIGQEAVAVALCECLNESDKLFATYRSHAFYLASGGDLNLMFAELFGKEQGCCRGKGGSMHLAAPEVGFMGTSAIVASSISHAVGSALAAKIRNLDMLSVAVFGEGATEEGVYHESLNFAALKNLPVLFVVENNGYAIHSPVSKRQSYSITEHAKQYGIESHFISLDMNPESLFHKLSPLVERARTLKKPLLLEVETYRYLEHVGISKDYHFGYREEKELLACQNQDVLIQDKALCSEMIDNIQAEIREAVHFAEQGSLPEAESLLEDIF